MIWLCIAFKFWLLSSFLLQLGSHEWVILWKHGEKEVPTATVSWLKFGFKSVYWHISFEPQFPDKQLQQTCLSGHPWGRAEPAGKLVKVVAAFRNYVAGKFSRDRSLVRIRAKANGTSLLHAAMCVRLSVCARGGREVSSYANPFHSELVASVKRPHFVDATAQT